MNKRFVFLFFSLCLSGVVGCSTTGKLSNQRNLLEQKNDTIKTRVIFDTDLAIDDWAALLLLAKTPSIDLVGVLANGVGESRCAPAMKNIPALLDLTEAGEVVIACGDDYPMDGYFAFPEPWRVQADTLSGVALPPSKRPVSSIHAVEALHGLLNKSDEPTVVLTTGSLTNVAQLIAKYPKDKAKISRLVIMGGAFKTKGNIIVPNFTDTHPNTRGEWNIYVDALAAARVFESGLPIEVVGLDVTNTVKVTKEFALNFKKKVSTPAAEFWDKVLDDNDWFIDSGEYYFWDVLAALVVMDSRFCQGEMESVWVSADAVADQSKWSLKSIPKTTSGGMARSHFNPKTAGITHLGGHNPKVKVCYKTNADRAFKVFIETMNQKP